MYYQILQWAIISLILIILVHYLYSFFKETLTIPKIKDLVNRPADAYKEMYETIEKVKQYDREKLPEIKKSDVVLENNDNMKDELKTFLNSLSSKTVSEPPTSKQEINSFEYGGSSFSTF
ncbi:MAG: hypothetical protein WD512_14525 [Candidatus Paceibacterota bacterium]